MEGLAIPNKYMLVMKLLRKSPVLIDEIKTDSQRRDVISAKYDLSKCERIYGLIRDYANDPTSSRWTLVGSSDRSYVLNDNETKIMFRVWHRYYRTPREEPKVFLAENIHAYVENVKVLNDDEKKILYVLLALGLEVEKNLKNLEEQQRCMHMENKLKGTY